MMNKNFDGKTLILVFENGSDTKGNPLYSRKSIKNIRQDATEEEIYNVGISLASLFPNQLANVCIDEDYILVSA